MPEYKLTEDGKSIVMENGHPVVIGDDKKEFTIDAIGANDKITALVTESNDRRKKLGVAETKLVAFGDIDPVVATKAVEDVAGMSDKNKADLEAQRDSINETWKSKEETWINEKNILNDNLFDATVGVKFATSQVVKRTVLPPNIAKATFGKQFKSDGSATDKAGNTIYSKTNPGEIAKFDEALSIILDEYPDKDSIMKGTGANGSGSGTGGDGDGGKNLSSTQKIAAGLKSRT